MSFWPIASTFCIRALNQNLTTFKGRQEGFFFYRKLTAHLESFPIFSGTFTRRANFGLTFLTSPNSFGKCGEVIPYLANTMYKM